MPLGHRAQRPITGYVTTTDVQRSSTLSRTTFLNCELTCFNTWNHCQQLSESTENSALLKVFTSVETGWPIPAFVIVAARNLRHRHEPLYTGTRRIFQRRNLSCRLSSFTLIWLLHNAHAAGAILQERSRANSSPPPDHRRTWSSTTRFHLERNRGTSTRR